MKDETIDLVLDKLALFWTENHIPPTLDELAEMTGKVKSQVKYILEEAEKNGDVICRNRKYIPLWVEEMFIREVQYNEG